jgi:signal transduction histidine kinase
VSHDEHSEWSDMASLASSGVTVAVVDQYMTHNHLKSAYPGIPYITRPTTLEVLQSIEDGAAEVAIVALEVASPLIHAHHLDHLRVGANVFADLGELRLGVRKDWPELVSIINKALEKIPAEEMKRVRNKWMAVPISVGSSQKEVWSIVLLTAALLGVVILVVMNWNRQLKKRVTAHTAQLQLQNQRIAYHNEVLETLLVNDLVSNTLNQSLESIIYATSETLKVERVSVWLYSSNRRSINCINLYERPLHRHSSGREWGVSTYPLYFHTLKSGQSLLIEDARKDLRCAELIEEYLIPLDIYSILNIPIRLNEQVTGVICCETTGNSRQWAVDEVNFVASISSFIALVLESDQRRKVEKTLRAHQEGLALTIKQRTHALRLAKEQTDGILASMAEGLVVVDYNGAIERVNPSFERLVGREESVLLGVLVEALFEDGAASEERRLIGGNKGSIPVSMTRAPIQQHRDTPPGEVLMIHDLRDRIKAERTRAEQENQLAYQAGLAEISANVLHNIGNAITTLTGRSEQIDTGLEDLLLIKQQLEQAASLEDVSRLQQGVKQTAVLLGEVVEEDLQESSRAVHVAVAHVAEIIAIQQELAHGNQAINTRFDISRVIHDTLALYQGSHQEQRIKMTVELSPLVEQVLLPKNPFQQVVTNLIKNAREAIQQRRALQGPLDGTIHLQLSPHGEDQFHLSLRDNGIGLEAEQLTTIFQRGVSSKEKGSGFGLHSVATFANALGGTIVAESKGRNQGATMILTLPIEMKKK